MKKPRILIVEPDEAAANRYRQALASLDSPELATVATTAAALERLAGGSFDLVVAGLDPAQPTDLKFLDEVHALDGELPTIVIAAHPSLDSATASLRAGVGDYLPAGVAPRRWRPAPGGCSARDGAEPNTSCCAARSSGPTASTT